jgi:hypothetical protein
MNKEKLKFQVELENYIKEINGKSLELDNTEIGKASYKAIKALQNLIDIIEHHNY